MATCERCKDAHAKHQMSLGRPDPRLLAERRTVFSSEAEQSAGENQAACVGAGWFNGEQQRRQQHQEFLYNVWLESQTRARRIAVESVQNTVNQHTNEAVGEPSQEMAGSGSGPMETDAIRVPARPMERSLEESRMNSHVTPEMLSHVRQPTSLQQFATLSQQPPDPVVTILPFARNKEEQQQLMDYALKLATGRQ